MAAGLPCVVSDWNGYRETVREAIDGWRIPTLAAPPGSGALLAARHADAIDSYDRYIGHASLAVDVDIAACAAAYARLAADAALRRRMGEAGRERARSEFDWRRIIARYQELWQALAERRRGAAREAPPALPDPRNPDPFWLFAEYPTRALAPADRLVASPQASGARLAELERSGLTNFAAPLLGVAATRLRLFEQVSRHPGIAVAELVSGAEPEHQATLLRALVWLKKFGLVRVQ